eukprot:CAMPEP_0170845126 /NCGR_PEP_ID=MMETSP0734-20130129/7387_1 /TAXON_ID=186038 /ORGANISM="Fragilariopsis kerguelensis, Strain L26-C5" /LENGTH=81 /DNA_ID=CAMNT_0011213865 /DNA_START=736 /DNA_END=981 /DNA_ORIENTATION=-
MTTAMSEKKKGATPVPSGEEEEAGSTLLFSTNSTTVRTTSMGSRKDRGIINPNEWHSHKESSNNNTQSTHTHYGGRARVDE